jgi:hypothetical protein
MAENPRPIAGLPPNVKLAEDRRKLHLWLAEFEDGQTERREHEITAS